MNECKNGFLQQKGWLEKSVMLEMIFIKYYIIFGNIYQRKTEKVLISIPQLIHQKS
jgi:hypothetical protein